MLWTLLCSFFFVLYGAMTLNGLRNFLGGRQGYFDRMMKNRQTTSSDAQAISDSLAVTVGGSVQLLFSLVLVAIAISAHASGPVLLVVLVLLTVYFYNAIGLTSQVIEALKQNDIRLMSKFTQLRLTINLLDDVTGLIISGAGVMASLPPLPSSHF